MATLNRTAIRNAVQTATDPAMLSRIARIHQTVYQHATNPRSTVSTFDLAANVYSNPEMSKIIKLFTEGERPQADDISFILGELIAASMIAARA